MTQEQIYKLVAGGSFPDSAGSPELIETHISWVILCEKFAYKIKKPIHYSFLDFSTIEKRHYYCKRELALNKRLTDDIYLDVQNITKKNGLPSVNGKDGEIIDYAVRMRKVNREFQMDLLLAKNDVTVLQIQQLAEKIASFHTHTDIIYRKDYLDVATKFKDLEMEKVYLGEQLGAHTKQMITHSIDASDRFVEKNKHLVAARLREHFYRDCHGDLHSRNIFFVPEPQPFDCIEFNDDIRQIDVLNEVAFLCMDLEALGRKDLSDLFMSDYNKLFPSMKTEEDRKLFVYYKSYRSNIRAKINSLRARSAGKEGQKKIALAEAEKYLQLMYGYIREIQ
ncbi:MAG: hypothetical protein ABIN89_08405 [Chitinophagaceae bacterium]